MIGFFACAACFGQSDSAMAAGMNWGILSLLVIIVSVLGGVAGFFIFLARRAAVVNGPSAAVAAFGVASSELNRVSSRKPFSSAPANRALKPTPTNRSVSHACCARGKPETRF